MEGRRPPPCVHLGLERPSGLGLRCNRYQWIALEERNTEWPKPALETQPAKFHRHISATYPGPASPGPEGAQGAHPPGAAKPRPIS